MTLVRLPTPSKYKNVRHDGYASRAEATRGAELELLEKAGKIRNLRRQVPFVLLPPAPELGYDRPLKYIVDFEYKDGDVTVREEVKGMWTSTAKIKVRLMEQLLGIHVTIVTGPRRK